MILVSYYMWLFGLLDKIIMRCSLGLSCEIILVGGGGLTNYHMIIHVGLSCEIQSHEPNIIRI